MVANCSVPHSLDIRRTHHVYGDRVPIYDQQHYVEPPPNVVASTTVRPAEVSVPRDTHPNHTRSQWLQNPTWRILRALQSISNANVVVGESIITGAAFFKGAGQPSLPFWGPQQGRQVILWESLSPEDQERCHLDLQKDAN